MPGTRYPNSNPKVMGWAVLLVRCVLRSAAVLDAVFPSSVVCVVVWPSSMLCAFCGKTHHPWNILVENPFMCFRDELCGDRYALRTRQGDLVIWPWDKLQASCKQCQHNRNDYAGKKWKYARQHIRLIAGKTKKSWKNGTLVFCCSIQYSTRGIISLIFH